MSTYNTYVGARYVPLLVGDWDTTKQTEYEPLTVVQYQGNSYTSRTYVPKNIDITNTEYWVVTGNYNAQVEAYRKEVEDVKSEYDGILDITNQTKMLVDRTFIFISDSYGEIRENTSWILETVSRLNLEQNKYYQAYKGGYGFAPAYSGGENATFLNLLKDLTVSDPNAITDIVVGGGFNDAKQTTEKLMSAIQEFCAYAKQTYPNSKIWIAGIGWSFNGEFIADLNYGNYLVAYKNNALGAIYMSGSDYVMHNKDLFLSEDPGQYKLFLGMQYVHPNAKGSLQIASAIVANLLGTSGGLNGAVITIDFTPADNVTVSGNVRITQKQSDGKIYWNNNQIIFTIPSTTFNYGANAVLLGTLNNGYVGCALSHGLSINTGGFIVDNSSNKECNILLAVRGNRLYAYALTTGTTTNIGIFESQCVTETTLV